MLGNFIRHYGINQFKEMTTAFSDAIIRFDPEGATEAAIAEMEENFDKVNREFSAAKRDWEKEDLEAQTIVSLNNRRLAAAEMLQKQLETDAANTEIQNGLGELVTALEEMADDVAREQEEAADAKAVMTELEAVTILYANKLKTARSSLEKARRDMASAERQKERAEDAADRAAILAGVKTTAGGLGTALDRMNTMAQEARGDADAATRKARLLAPTSVDTNTAVAAALAAVNGDTPVGAQTVAQRLAALRK